MGVQLDQHNTCADVPVVDGALWRGIAWALVFSLPLWGLIVLAIAWLA